MTGRVRNDCRKVQRFEVRLLERQEREHHQVRKKTTRTEKIYGLPPNAHQQAFLCADRLPWTKLDENERLGIPEGRS
jgi:hypothetical protein